MDCKYPNFILAIPKQEKIKMENNKTPQEITQLVLKGVALAMGVAVVVVGVVGNTPITAQVTMLGLGLFCLALSALQNT